MTVAITRLDLSAADLRQAAARTQNAKIARRTLAVAHVLEGNSRRAAAESCAMGRQTLRDWVHRYNASGLAGLSDLARRNGRELNSKLRSRTGLSRVPIWRVTARCAGGGLI